MADRKVTSVRARCPWCTWSSRWIRVPNGPYTGWQEKVARLSIQACVVMEVYHELYCPLQPGSRQ